MPTTVRERVRGRRHRTGAGGFFRREYIIAGEATEADALDALFDAMVGPDTPPATIEGLPVESTEIDQVDEALDLYIGTVEWRLPSAGGGGSGPTETEAVVSWQTGGGRVRVFQSLSTEDSAAAMGDPIPDYKGAIGVTDSGVEGVDIVVPRFTWREQHRIENATVTLAYRQTVSLLTGRTNNAIFRTNPIGTVQFLGASGQKRGAPDDTNAPWDIAFDFAFAPNRTGFVVGDLGAVDIGGWEHAWVRYAAVEVAGEGLLPRPKAIYVERVLEAGDFSALVIGVS